MTTDPGANLLVSFLNTVHVPDAERLRGSSGASWLSTVTGEAVEPDEQLDDALHDLRVLREAIRALTRTGPDARPAIALAQRSLRAIPLVLALNDDLERPAHLVPAGPADPVTKAVAAIAETLLQTAAAGVIRRVKTCADPACQWAFYDSSRNSSRRWCRIDGCGNRAKNRTYRARQARSGTTNTTAAGTS